MMAWSLRREVHSVKMYFSFKSVIPIGLFLISLTADSSGELIMIRSPQQTNNKSMKIKFTCVTDDDQGALFWMGNPKNIDLVDDCALTWTKNTITGCSYDFSTTSNVRSIEWSTMYSTIDWKVKTKTSYPPVPGLKSLVQGKGYFRFKGWLDNLQESGSLVFFHQGPLNRRLHLRRYENPNCTSHPNNSYKSEYVDQYEWHADTLAWNGTTINGSNKRCDENSPFIYVKPEDSDGLVFYGYRYLYTNEVNSFLEFIVDSPPGEICLGLLFSLCPECYFEITIFSNQNELNVTRSTSRQDVSEHGQNLTWLMVKYNKTLPVNDPKNHIIKITAKNSRPCSECYWSFHSIRPCASIPSKRNSRKISAIIDCPLKLSCQKVSNDGSILVNSNTKFTNNISKSLKECLRKDGPICNFECGASCKGTVICESIQNLTRCTCAPGFRGRNCRTECGSGRFGYYCALECKGCRNKKCTRTDGTCVEGCEDYNYLPPYCERSLEKPRIEYSHPIRIRCYQDLQPHEMNDIRFEIQKQGKPEGWVRINSTLVAKDTLEWSKDSIECLELDTVYEVRAILNETKSFPEMLNVTLLLKHMVNNMKATNLSMGITKLEWHSLIHLRNVKWFCLKIELLAKQRNDSSLPDPVWKLYPVKKNQTKYGVTVLLETAADYEISSFVSSDDASKTLVLATTRYYTLSENTYTITKKKLQKDRDATSIALNLTSIVNKTNNATVRILVYGSTSCSNKIASLTNAKIEWEAFTYEGKDTMPEILTISNISDCELLPDEAYKVGVLVSDPVKRESTLIVIDIPVVSDFEWIWTIVVPILLCVLLAAYTSYRYLNEQPRQPIYEHEFPRLDSGAYPDKLVAFENSVRKDAVDGLLEQQYTLLPKGLVRPCEYGRLPENKYKNRYGNMIAFQRWDVQADGLFYLLSPPDDETRVMLVKNPCDPYSDYINANYIQGYSKKNAYIATQAPLPDTIVDFWRMVWQEEVRVICMLVDLIEGHKVMCEKYWPEVGRKVAYGDLVISNLTEHQFVDYTCRIFVVSTHSGMERRQVDHLQYRGWTDQEIPMYSHSFLEYLKKLWSIAPGPGPIVVHCCAGVGRTGCIILCDICLHQIIVEGTANVRMEAETMYNARANMLHNYLQYTLAHLVPIQFRRTLPTTVPCRDLSPEKIEQLKNDVPEHIGWLKSSAWMHEALRPLEPLRPRHPENVSKNRFPKLMPVGPYLVKLPRYPAYDATSDYISAVSVDGVKMKKQYLASQLPMPSTLTDFWRLIVEENVELIVILQNPDPDDPTCCAVIPREKTLIPYPYMKVQTKETLECNEYFTTSMLLLTDTSEASTKTRNITAITCNDWRLDLVTNPPPPKALVKLWVASEKIKRTSAPTLILCYDGVTACGLYIAMSFVLQRMSLEEECDVISAVQAVRRSRSEFVQFPWEFHYLYDAAMEYMESFKMYANLT